jgi:hypothetical protein
MSMPSPPFCWAPSTFVVAAVVGDGRIVADDDDYVIVSVMCHDVDVSLLTIPNHDDDHNDNDITAITPTMMILQRRRQ